MRKIKSNIKITTETLIDRGVSFVPFCAILDKSQRRRPQGMVNSSELDNLKTFYYLITGKRESTSFINFNKKTIRSIFFLCRRNSLKCLKNYIQIEKSVLRSARLVNKDNPIEAIFSRYNKLDKYIFNYLSEIASMDTTKANE